MPISALYQLCLTFLTRTFLHYSSYQHNQSFLFIVVSTRNARNRNPKLEVKAKNHQFLLRYILYVPILDPHIIFVWPTQEFDE
jgi:hypothetical protein